MLSCFLYSALQTLPSRNVLLGRAGRFAAAETPAWQPVSSVDRTPLSSTVQENHQGRGAVAAEQRLTIHSVFVAASPRAPTKS
ncbi:hypothetical protein Y1Q_0000175 [Alligator mississippiensis]|uniref:Uncharacterized protein n=1 Tax=Alligator mississippiensis TaxID=8496 RepID=A0A151N030_ALLMI|nr:hypothetical protein Y1Q_0000175 [Alligator mississippiensis]